MEKKGNEFKGLAGGKNYRNFARLFGFTTAFYRKGVSYVRNQCARYGCKMRFENCPMDNWRNVYSELCRQHGLQPKEDGYINSIVRRQVFQKE
jgi:hypothetical protein